MLRRSRRSAMIINKTLYTTLKRFIKVFRKPHLKDTVLYHRLQDPLQKRLLSEESFISFIICSVGSRDELIDKFVIPSILKQGINNFEVIIVGKYSGIYEHKDPVRCIEVRELPFYFFKPFQKGFEASKGDWIVDLDDDMVISDDWYSNLLASVKRLKADVYGFKLLNSDGSAYGDTFKIFALKVTDGDIDNGRVYFGSYISKRWIFQVIPYPTYMSGDREQGFRINELGVKKCFLSNVAVIHFGTVGRDTSIPRADSERYKRTLDLRKRLELISPTTKKDYKKKMRQWWSYARKIEKQTKNIGILGWYGHRNLGDELILRTIISFFQKHHISVYSDNAYNLKEYYGINRTMHFRNLRHDLKHLDILLIGGGGVLYDRYICKVLPKNLILGCRTPIIVYAAGIPFLDWLTNQTDYFLKRCYMVTLRDNLSLNYFQKQFPDIASQLLPDPVFCIPQVAGQRIRKKVVLNIQMIPKGWGQGLPDNVNEILVRELDRLYNYLADKAYSPIILGFEPRDESFLINKDYTYKMVDLDEAIKEIRTAEIMVGTRYHSAIIAITQKTPALLVNYQQKIESLQFLISSGIKIVNIEGLDLVKEFKAFISRKVSYRTWEIQSLQQMVYDFNRMYIDSIY